MVDERRAHLRVPFKGGAEVKHKPARGKDVSAGGVALRTHAHLKVGAIVAVALDLPEATVKAEAEVVRVGEDEVGFRFVRLDQKALLALTSYVATMRSADGAVEAPRTTLLDIGAKLAQKG